MLKFQKIFCGSGPFVLTAVLLVGAASISEASDSFSSDELFEKSVAALRATMEKARSSNDTLKEQNRALQERAEKIEQAITDLEEQKSDIQREIRHADDQATLADKENALYQARIKNLSSRQARVNDEHARLEKRLKFFLDDNEQAQEAVGPLQKEISDLQIILDKDSPHAQKKNKKVIVFPSQNHIQALQKHVTFHQQLLQDNLAEKASREQKNTVLTSDLAAEKEKLTQLKSFQEDSSQSDPELRQAIRALQDYRDNLQSSLRGFNHTMATAKSVKSKDLENVFKQLEQQHILLQQKLSLAQREPAMVGNTKDRAVLLARKEILSQQNDELQTKIAAAKKESAMQDKGVPAVSGANTDLINKIKKSSERITDLQKQIKSRMTSSLPTDQKSQDLTNEIETVEKSLQALREENASDESATPQDAGVLQEEIGQLEARRNILADTVESIHSKYKLDDISVKEKDPGAKQAQLQEYGQALKLENNALQEKLLILQMRQDKKSQPEP